VPCGLREIDRRFRRASAVTYSTTATYLSLRAVLRYVQYNSNRSVVTCSTIANISAVTCSTIANISAVTCSATATDLPLRAVPLQQICRYVQCHCNRSAVTCSATATDLPLCAVLLPTYLPLHSVSLLRDRPLRAISLPTDMSLRAAPLQQTWCYVQYHCVTDTYCLCDQSDRAVGTYQTITARLHDAASLKTAVFTIQFALQVITERSSNEQRKHGSIKNVIKSLYESVIKRRRSCPDI
jgi:hypothetical protein